MDAELSKSFDGLDLNSNKTKLIHDQHAAQNGFCRADSKKVQQFTNLTASLDTLFMQISDLENTYRTPHPEGDGTGPKLHNAQKALHTQLKGSMTWIDNSIYDKQKKL